MANRTTAITTSNETAKTASNISEALESGIVTVRGPEQPSVDMRGASQVEETKPLRIREDKTDISCNNPRSHSNMVAMSEVENDDSQNNRDMRDISTANDANRECEITLKDVMSRLEMTSRKLWEC